MLRKDRRPCSFRENSQKISCVNAGKVAQPLHGSMQRRAALQGKTNDDDPV
jgi:hypothetical protein